MINCSYSHLTFFSFNITQNMSQQKQSVLYRNILRSFFYDHVVLHEISYTIHLSVSYQGTFSSFAIINSAIMNNLQHTYLFIFLPMYFRGRILGVEVSFQGEKNIYNFARYCPISFDKDCTILVELHQQCLKACFPTTSQKKYAINFWISASLIGDKQYLGVVFFFFFL